MRTKLLLLPALLLAVSVSACARQFSEDERAKLYRGELKGSDLYEFNAFVVLAGPLANPDSDYNDNLRKREAQRIADGLCPRGYTVLETSAPKLRHFEAKTLVAGATSLSTVPGRSTYITQKIACPK